MGKLYCWFNTLGQKLKGVPQSSNMWLADSSSIVDYKDSPIKGEWVSFNPYRDSFPFKKSLKLPKELFLFIKTKDKPVFDWCYTHHYVMIFSEEFLNYFLSSNQGVNNQIEIAKLNVINVNGFEYDRRYFAVRIVKFDDDRFDFNESIVKKRGRGLRNKFMYPEIKLLENNKERNIYFLREFCYNPCLILTESAKKDILSTFYCPEIYSAKDYYLAFNNFLNKEKLPKMEQVD